jgi:hypothetical protein
MFVNDIISFLNVDNISYEYLSNEQLRNVLEERSYHQQQKDYPNKQQQQQQHYYYSVDEIMQLVKQDVFLIIGNSHSTSNKYVLHLCSIPNLTTMIMSYQQYHHSISNASSSNASSNSTSSSHHAVAAHAWLNSHLTNAFSSLSSSSSSSSSSSNDHQYQLVVIPSSIVHLHYDVWHRSTNIVKSRLRTKCGIYKITTANANAGSGGGQGGRYYARKTIVQRIDNKNEGNSFLMNNHLWGSTNYKYAYGLYINCPQESTSTLTPSIVVAKKCNDDDTDTHQQPTQQQQQPTQQQQQLIAMVTFSSGRKVLRSNKPYISYELLRYCTAQDTTIVGGLTKLISAFVKDIKKKKKDNNMKEEEEEEGMDIVTSIDCDFGYGCGTTSTWPNFNTVHIMDPIPMFVSSSSTEGGGDGIRRHVIGCGLLPLDQYQHQQPQQQTGLTNNDNDNAISNNNLLRAGLPNWLLHRLDERCRNANKVNDSTISSVDESNNSNIPTTTTMMMMTKDTAVYDPWQDVAQYGYHPVFDTGVERLMMLVDDNNNNMNNAATTNGDIPSSSSTTMTPMELWDASTPCYAREHYSSNAGVSAMLDCIRSARRS